MNTDKPKMGRPRLRPDVALDKSLKSHVADDELQQIQAAASACGLSVSQYVRAASLGTASLDPKTRDKIFTAGNAIPN
jgi:hypothetical protein